MKAKMPQRTFAIPADLLTGLQECGDAFERMRYLYEDPMAALFYLNDLPRVLIEAILELRPDWTPAHQTQPTSQAR